ncbi:MAG: sulfur carrier protein ThiS [Acidobacteriota bacterium]
MTVVEVVINGETVEVEAEMTLGRWLESQGRDPRVVAVERNGDIVPRGDFDATVIERGDRLEIVQFVQGG